MKNRILFTAAMLATFTAFGQQQEGKKNIEKLCGCFEVQFKYAETFSPDEDYKFHNRENLAAGAELVVPVEMSDKKISLQHLLVISDTMVVKHWREDWTYENPELFVYKGDKTWEKTALNAADVKGKWTQTVWEVSEAPRYQGISQWYNTDGKTIWENTTDAPLPRREYSTRSDYNVLQRGNRIIINEEGWIHDQDNKKIIRENGTDKLLVEEKGVNSYKKIDDKQCAAGLAYWKKNKLYWAKVKTVWDDYMAKHNSITIKDKVDGKYLHEYLFAQAKDFATGKIKNAEIDASIKTSVEKFFTEAKQLATTK
ncbi:hypothetical protein DC498_03925 [Terrimonas sp.]|uniref:DUF6607 family protein n=1 Tax=Terrimonas sp. TaxID=1914338 RepID=UPI000D518D36|nr:DUF6607 family protein [Terrimonas sp.]PVD53670.1 hypothetical protein DC498_03925 [Terrimonas sp.]